MSSRRKGLALWSVGAGLLVGATWWACGDSGSTCAEGGTDCPLGFVCREGRCVIPCADVLDCPQSYVCHDEICVSGGDLPNDPCQGVICNDPPAGQCVNNDATYRTYQAPGTCGDTGRCSYPSTDIPCANCTVECLGGCLGGVPDRTPCDLVDPGDQAGVCVGGDCVACAVPDDCDDANPCTSDTCDNHECVNERLPDNTSCGTSEETNWGDCGEFADVCDETGSRTKTVTDWKCFEGSCREDIHDVSGDCSRDTSGLSCEDGNDCTVGDQCDGGGCSSGPRNVNDQACCEGQECWNGSSCVNGGLGGQCGYDGSWCISCVDGDPCTHDYCLVGGGCNNPDNGTCPCGGACDCGTDAFGDLICSGETYWKSCPPDGVKACECSSTCAIINCDAGCLYP